MNQSHARALRAILSADIVGYSKLMSEDEDRTLSSLRSMRQDLFFPAVEQFGGTVAKNMGDGWLVEFNSASDALRCAIQVQEALLAQELIRLRVGIHTGDIAHVDDDIFGDGVNIAARLEKVSQPGGIAVSDTARRSMESGLAGQLKDLGEHPLKNIPDLMRIFGWQMDEPFIEDASLALQEKPSVAVLPFRTPSGDDDQEMFADGLTEDLTTDLSKVSGLFVVARNSCLALKGQNLAVSEAARRLGVRNIVEGSVRRAGTRVRINVQLVDGVNGSHLWANRFDGSTDDVFELQDEVGANVVSALEVRLTANENNRLQQVHTRNLEAYELFVKAKALPYPPVPERIQQAQTMFERVMDMDPDFAGGYAGVAWMLGFKALWSHVDPDPLTSEAEKLARQAISVDADFGWSYTAQVIPLMLMGRYDEAVAASHEGVERRPNDADAYALQGLSLAMSGEPRAGVVSVEAAIRLSPEFHQGPYLNLLGFCKLLADDPQGTVKAFETNVMRQGPVGPPLLAWVAAAQVRCGNQAAAAGLRDKLLSAVPQFRLEGWNFLKCIRSDAIRQQVRDDMARAGIPE